MSNKMTKQEVNEKYKLLNRALRGMRDNFMMGDLSGFETHTDLVEAIRATEREVFELIRDNP